MNVLYHLTNKENLEKILMEGIKPNFGDNSKLINDERLGVFLTKLEDVNMWGIILKKNYLIKINIDGLSLTENKYPCCTEFICEKTIGPEKILNYNDSSPSYKLNERETLLFESYIFYICNLTKQFIISKTREKYHKYIDFYLKDIKVLTKINLPIKECLTIDVIRDYLIDMGESGEYTLFDYHIINNLNMIEEIKVISKDFNGENKIILEDYIKYLTNQFGELTNLCTGGWE